MYVYTCITEECNLFFVEYPSCDEVVEETPKCKAYQRMLYLGDVNGAWGALHALQSLVLFGALLGSGGFEEPSASLARNFVLDSSAMLVEHTPSVDESLHTSGR